RPPGPPDRPGPRLVSPSAVARRPRPSPARGPPHRAALSVHAPRDRIITAPTLSSPPMRTCPKGHDAARVAAMKRITWMTWAVALSLGGCGDDGTAVSATYPTTSTTEPPATGDATTGT